MDGLRVSVGNQNVHDNNEGQSHEVEVESDSSDNMPQASTSTSKYDPRIHVGLSEERVTDVSSTDFPGHHPDEDHSWDLGKFKKVYKNYSSC